jgi:YfiH family protein
MIQEVRESDGSLKAYLPATGGKPNLEGDGLITDLPRVLIAVGTADCVPVLVADTSKKVVAAFHAGWRGTVSRIVETGIARLQESYGSRTEDLVAAVGPSIGPCCYSVGNEVVAEFASKFTYADQLFRTVSTPEPWRTDAAPNPPSEDRLHLDLWEANRRQLLHAGLADAQITVLAACTACSRGSQGELQYFSHRGEHGVAGRMLSVVGITEECPDGNKIVHA